jgi:hypothetical protein
MAAREAMVGESGSAHLGKQAQAWMEFLRQARTNRPSQVSEAQDVGGARVIADYTRPGATVWKVDGEAFGPGPVRAGEMILGNSPDRPIAGVMPYGAAKRDLFWKGLKTAPGNENDVGRLAATSRAGQMLRTPTFTLEGGKLHYLIRGKTRAYAEVDSHLMNEGPLHAALAKTFESLNTPRWVTHDLSAYIGHRVHVEFGPDGENELEILMVVEAAEAPKWLPSAAGIGPEKIASPHDFQAALLKANKALASGSVFDDLQLANFIIQNPGLFGE